MTSRYPNVHSSICSLGSGDELQHPHLREPADGEEILHTKCEKLSEHLVHELIIPTAVFSQVGTQIFTDESQFTEK